MKHLSDKIKLSKWIAAGLAIYALLGGLITLIGWFAGIPRLTDWVGTGISMFPNTATAAACAGVALLLSIQNKRQYKLASAVLGGIVAFIGGATLFEHLSGINLGIDTLLFKAEWGSKAATAPGRMGPPASISYMLIGIAIVAAAGNSKVRRRAPDIAMVVIAIAMLSLLGYLFNADELFAIKKWTGIALQTASIILGLGVGILASMPEYQPVQTICQNSSAGLLVRRALPIILIVPILLGWIRVWGQNAGHFDTGMGTAMLVLALIILLAATLWWCAAAVGENESALSEREQLFRTLVHSSSQSVWHLRPGAESISQLDKGNAAWWREFTGQTEEQRTAEGGQGWLSAVHDEDRAAARAGWANINAATSSSEVQYRARRRDGEWRWLQVRAVPIQSEDGALIEWAGTVSDITERKQAEDALELLSRLPEENPAPVMRIQSGGVLSFANRAASQVLKCWGISTGDKVPSDVADVVNSALVDDKKRSLELVFGQIVYTVAVVPVRNANYVNLYFSDITASKRAEEELQRADRRKDEFLAVVSHELRTPLTAILGWVGLINGKKVPPETAEHGMQVIERNVKAQRQVIEDLLDVSRIVTGKMSLHVKAIELYQVCHAAIESVRPALQTKKINLKSSLISQRVVCDRERLLQVLLNLLSNAIKFTPAGGEIKIAAERVNAHVRIVVADNGDGIDPAFRPHLFNRFKQADSSATRKAGGLGLGLAIVRHVVDLHGGTVRAESDGPGKGSTFIVELPIGSIDEPAAQPAADSAPGNVLNGLPVLVIDDDVDTREYLMLALQEIGGVPSSATGAAEALEMIHQQKFDLILSDIAMPEEDGYSLIRKIRSWPDDGIRSLPVLALSAFAREEDRQRALAAGFDGHVAKPIEPARLLDAINSVMSTTADARRKF